MIQNATYEYDCMAMHMQHETMLVEKNIKEDFKKLHQLLNEEEKAMLGELKQEKDEKLQRMKDKKTNKSLSNTIRDLERELDCADIRLLQNFKYILKRAKHTLEDPMMAAGELINSAKYLGNLKFSVWRNIRISISYIPVILDPNMVNYELELSKDLSHVWNPNEIAADEYLAGVPLPKNLERFDCCPCVLGYVSYSTGTHTSC
ncbi:E3 ubiquitin-protein ligase TRIM35-like [Myxocyprinus asiaticus]|uniref:E3 ubiquitin-protein ligase TRIM35-like n=1 Tax=Myxocyprinus asiaticus TaxID=70543 RepID=UPI002221A738|nr:E3 ubiquitin-protein ligase TRIM35-like [Myxocyprinus asiaticus]